jgi:DNA-binding NarL/FixJ family response regulator
MARPIRVAIVDDHLMVREGLRSEFKHCANVDVAAEADSLADLEALADNNNVDVLILDLSLRDGSSLAMIRKLRRSKPRLRIVVLTMHSQVHYALHALDAGADGFVVKGSPFEDLVQAVTAASEGRKFVCRTMSPLLLRNNSRRTRQRTLDALSAREFEVLTLLSHGLTQREIARQLDLSEKTISTYRTRIMQKLGLKSGIDLVRLSFETGLIPHCNIPSREASKKN